MTNDSPGKSIELPSGSLPDPNGHAAMLLVESLIHGLIARSVLTVAEAVDIVDSAREVSAEINHERAPTHSATDGSTAILVAIGDSLKRDTDLS